MPKTYITNPRFYEAVQSLFPTANWVGPPELRDCVIRDDGDGNGPYIATWNIASPIPDAPAITAALAAIDAPAPVASVTPRQARLALLGAGALDQVEAAVKAAGGATLITWEYASAFERHDPLITAIGSQLNMSEAQIDALFAQAATL